MASNLSRFEKDLEDLIHRGKMLEQAIQYEAYNPDFANAVRKNLKEKADDFFKSLPDFHKKYETWYSEALFLVKQLLPDRVNNFISLYERSKTRKVVTYENYTIQDYMLHLVIRLGHEIKVDGKAAVPKFRQQLSILDAAKARFKSSLFEIRQLVQADLFDSEIETARELWKNNFFRAAGAISGVVLEKHLQQVCNDHNITVKKNPGISVLNEALKSQTVIDVPQWRHISMLGDIRNVCDHSKGQDPTKQQVEDLINGTDKILKTVF